MFMSPTPMKSASASSLTTTMTLLAVELSRAPRSSSHVISMHDRERRQVDENRDAGDACGAVVEQTAHVGIRAEKRGAIAGREPGGQVDAERRAAAS